MALTTVPVIAAAAVLWLLGAFSSAALYDSGGFGEASANLNFLFNSLGKSRFVPALPHPYIKWAEEGFGYQGIGPRKCCFWISGRWRSCSTGLSWDFWRFILSVRAALRE